MVVHSSIRCFAYVLCHAEELRIAASVPPLAAEGVRLPRGVRYVEVVRGDPLLEEQAVLLVVVVVVVVITVIIVVVIIVIIVVVIEIIVVVVVIVVVIVVIVVVSVISTNVVVRK